MKEPLYWKMRRFFKQLLCNHEWVDSMEPPYIVYGQKCQEQFCKNCLKMRIERKPK